MRLERGHRKRAAKDDLVLPPINCPNIFNQLSDLATPLNKSAPEAEDQSFPLPITPADSNVSLLGANVKKSDVKTADTDVKKAETDVKSLKSDVTEEHADPSLAVLGAETGEMSVSGKESVRAVSGKESVRAVSGKKSCRAVSGIPSSEEDDGDAPAATEAPPRGSGMSLIDMLTPGKHRKLAHALQLAAESDEEGQGHVRSSQPVSAQYSENTCFCTVNIAVFSQ